MELTERLRAALDETERVAREAGASFLGTSGRTWRRDLISCVVDADGRLIVYGEGTPTSAQADHIALHDPERELRMVAAHRQILDLHAGTVEVRDIAWDKYRAGKMPTEAESRDATHAE